MLARYNAFLFGTELEFIPPLMLGAEERRTCDVSRMCEVLCFGCVLAGSERRCERSDGVSDSTDSRSCECWHAVLSIALGEWRDRTLRLYAIHCVRTFQRACRELTTSGSNADTERNPVRHSDNDGYLQLYRVRV